MTRNQARDSLSPPYQRSSRPASQRTRPRHLRHYRALKVYPTRLPPPRRRRDPSQGPTPDRLRRMTMGTSATHASTSSRRDLRLPSTPFPSRGTSAKLQNPPRSTATTPTHTRRRRRIYRTPNKASYHPANSPSPSRLSPRVTWAPSLLPTNSTARCTATRITGCTGAATTPRRSTGISRPGVTRSAYRGLVPCGFGKQSWFHAC